MTTRAVRPDIHVARVSELIGMIYDCTLDAAKYVPTLEAVRAELSFENAALQIWNGHYQNPLTIQSGIAPEWMARWPAYGDDIVALWGGPERAAQFPIEEPILHSQAIGREVAQANRYFLEWAQPQCIFDAVAMNFAREPNMVGTLAFGRHESAGDVTDIELAVLRTLAPHFRRAAAIGRLLEQRTFQVATFAATLNGLATAIVFVDRHMRAVHANSAGERLLREQTVMSPQRGIVVLRDSAANERLRAAVSVAARDEAQLGRSGIGIAARSQQGDPLVVHLLPLTRGATRAGLVTSAVGALFVAPSHAGPPLPSDALAALYDLTPAETRVAELLADARTLVDIGRTLGIAVSTVNTHLARLFAKTGCSRQAELAVLLRSFRGPG
jgi:DNA-binding CsgD family transcriptional regulator